jgi:hypothetical protein
VEDLSPAARLTRCARSRPRIEDGWLARISRSHSEPVAHVAWATVLLAVAAGQSYTGAASIYRRSSHSYSLSLFLHQRSNQPQ